MAEHGFHIGMIGLGVMGRNLALNIVDKGYSVAGYDVDPEKVEAFNREGSGRTVKGVRSLEEFTAALRPPRSIMMLVPAGEAVDEVIGRILPLLDLSDLLMDGGNSNFRETDGRALLLSEHGILYMGVGISGGERGARFGPSIMPGGPQEGYGRVRAILESVAAKVDGEACCAYVGPGSAGHYVKMVHNGIEYALIQLIAESYHIMSRGLGLTNDELSDIYGTWNASALKGYLMEITARIFARRDEESGQHLIDLIMDEAEEKGTGKWTAQDAMDLRVPVPTVDMAVTVRDLSSLHDERRHAAGILKTPEAPFQAGKDDLLGSLRDGLLAGMILSYAQGMAQLARASSAYGYDLKLADIARIWRGGCIIRSDLLEPIRKAFERAPGLTNLVLDPDISVTVCEAQHRLRAIVCEATRRGIPIPALSSCLAYFDGYRSGWLPANLIQAQRDYFGSHGYGRIDREGVFHTQWE
jgi:6-phosphogluconate dehydrogenase